MDCRVRSGRVSLAPGRTTSSITGSGLSGREIGGWEVAFIVVSLAPGLAKAIDWRVRSISESGRGFMGVGAAFKVRAMICSASCASSFGSAV